MPTAVQKMSLEEFLVQPGETFHDLHELHDGEVVEVLPPTLQRMQVQERLRAALHETLGLSGYWARAEFYLALPTESRRVDVALIKTERLAKQPHNRVFVGSPELVVEVLSPSNTVLDVDRLRNACVKDGCVEFWVVNMELRSVTVYSQDLKVDVYIESNEVPLTSFADAPPISVKQIFE